MLQRQLVETRFSQPLNTAQSEPQLKHAHVTHTAPRVLSFQPVRAEHPVDEATLQRLLEVAKQLPTDELPRLMGDLEHIRCVALARLNTPAAQHATDALIDVTAGAKLLGVSRSYLYQHHGEFPFTRREGRKLLFSRSGIDAYIRQRRR